MKNNSVLYGTVCVLVVSNEISDLLYLQNKIFIRSRLKLQKLFFDSYRFNIVYKYFVMISFSSSHFSNWSKYYSLKKLFVNQKILHVSVIIFLRDFHSKQFWFLLSRALIIFNFCLNLI